jgi:arylsulfatase A-like enzyme
MNQNGNEPFLCFVPFNLIHSPLHDPRPAGYSIRSVYSDIIDATSGVNASWANSMAMLEALDVEFGRLVNGLAPAIRQRTLIVFTADTGTSSTMRVAREVNGKQLGPVYDALLDVGEGRFKNSVYEGGLRVPMLVQGPPGLVRNVPRSSPALIDVHVDIFETCRALMQIPYRDVVPDGRQRDGISFLGPLLSPSLSYSQHLRQFSFAYRFVRNGDGDDLSARAGRRHWSYIRHVAGDGTYKLISRNESHELYRIRDDSGGTTGADPFELSPLDIRGAWQTQYESVQTEAQALLESEFASP